MHLPVWHRPKIGSIPRVRFKNDQYLYCHETLDSLQTLREDEHEEVLVRTPKEIRELLEPEFSEIISDIKNNRYHQGNRLARSVRAGSQTEIVTCQDRVLIVIDHEERDLYYIGAAHKTRTVPLLFNERSWYYTNLTNEVKTSIFEELKRRLDDLALTRGATSYERYHSLSKVIAHATHRIFASVFGASPDKLLHAAHAVTMKHLDSELLSLAFKVVGAKEATFDTYVRMWRHRYLFKELLKKAPGYAPLWYSIVESKKLDNSNDFSLDDVLHEVAEHYGLRCDSAREMLMRLSPIQAREVIGAAAFAAEAEQLNAHELFQNSLLTLSKLPKLPPLSLLAAAARTGLLDQASSEENQLTQRFLHCAIEAVGSEPLVFTQSKFLPILERVVQVKLVRDKTLEELTSWSDFEDAWANRQQRVADCAKEDHPNYTWDPPFDTQRNGRYRFVPINGMHELIDNLARFFPTFDMNNYIGKKALYRGVYQVRLDYNGRPRAMLQVKYEPEGSSSILRPQVSELAIEPGRSTEAVARQINWLVLQLPSIETCK